MGWPFSQHLGFVGYSVANVLLADLTRFTRFSGRVFPHGYWAGGSNGARLVARGDLDAVACAQLPYLLARSYWRWCAQPVTPRNYFMNIVARGVVHRLRTQVFDALIRVPKVVIDGYTRRTGLQADL